MPRLQLDGIELRLRPARRLTTQQLRRVDADGEAVQTEELLVATTETGLEALQRRFGSEPAAIAAGLIAADPELPLALVGLPLARQTVLLDVEGEVVTALQQVELRVAADGSEIERRQLGTTATSVLQLASRGRRLPIEKVVRGWALGSLYRLDAATAESAAALQALARELAATEEMLLIAAEDAPSGPLRLRGDDSPAYEAFLEAHGMCAGDAELCPLYLRLCACRLPGVKL